MRNWPAQSVLALSILSAAMLLIDPLAGLYTSKAFATSRSDGSGARNSRSELLRGESNTKKPPNSEAVESVTCLEISPSDMPSGWGVGAVSAFQKIQEIGDTFDFAIKVDFTPDPPDGVVPYANVGIADRPENRLGYRYPFNVVIPGSGSRDRHYVRIGQTGCFTPRYVAYSQDRHGDLYILGRYTEARWDGSMDTCETSPVDSWDGEKARISITAKRIPKWTTVGSSNELTNVGCHVVVDKLIH